MVVKDDVCERWRVTKFGGDKVVWERWCVTKWCKDGVSKKMKDDV